MAKETERLENTEAQGPPVVDQSPGQPARGRRPGLRDVFRQAFEKARGEQKAPITQQQKSRDRGKSLFLLVGAAFAVLLMFFAVFSSPNRTSKQGQMSSTGKPDLGRRETPGQRAASQMGSVTPLMTADTSRSASPDNTAVTADDVDKTARPRQQPLGQQATPKSEAANLGRFALGQIDFSNPEQAPAPHRQPASMGSTDELRKPSLVFVRNAEIGSMGPAPRAVSATIEESPLSRILPAGTRLVARLQSVVSSALSTPVVASIEYNYESSGEILVPAGAQVIGKVQRADRSGYLAISFDTLEMPDGTSEKISATAMSLAYGPLKGTVSGKHTGTNLLVRSFTGLGTVASYLVGGNGLNAPLSESALLRERIAENVGVAGDQALNSLAFNQNIVVTIPANTRFYVVLQKPSFEDGAGNRSTSPLSQTTNNTAPPTLDELRQLMQLRRELSEMYQAPNPQPAPAQQQPQQ
jgi:Bacterial conjugation TrbI-like protein